ncbi:hypothetical protein TRIUR3_06566 [Triticum urartu]|uniref:Uncharacterized protein n=1 Tax=Triticum urartu TaxID=4572 RepID=M7ZUP6_TRIUA|nr:hypothetical protein TRIUR3_06566 [Triticum urartu]
MGWEGLKKVGIGFVGFLLPPPYVEEAEGSSPCSSPEQGSNARDGQGCSIELVDDFSALDGEVGKRLNDMVPVPHVPKTNGDIPSFDEAFSAHRRLLDRLVLYGLVELKVNGDGNCQFRALSDQFYRTPEHHRFVRQQVVNQLESHPEIYAGYVPMDYREYLKKMPKSVPALFLLVVFVYLSIYVNELECKDAHSHFFMLTRNGEWGDHVTLQAAADLLEKLRKRYRTEAARPVTSLWPFFRRMERLERGPVPVSTNSFPASPPASDDDQDQDLDPEEEEEDEEELEEEDEEQEEDQEEEEEQLLVARNTGSHTRSINGLVRDAGGFRGHQQQQQQRRPSPPAVTLSTAPPRKRVSYEAAMFQSKAAAADRAIKAEEAPAVDHGSVAGVLRDIGEGIKRLERRRMEVQWEIERGWKETEARSNQILQDAQRQLQDTLAALPPPGKKARRDHGSSADGL